MIYIFNFTILEQTLERENECIIELRLCFQTLREDLTNKMSVEAINSMLLEIEKKARVFKKKKKKNILYLKLFFFFKKKKKKKKKKIFFFF